MPRIYKKKYVSRRSRYPRKTSKKSAKPSRSFVKKVQKIVNADVESKEAHYTYALTAFNSGVNSAGDVIRVLPQVTIGTTTGARIGDVVQGQKLRIRGHMLINTTPITTGSGVIPTGIPNNCRLMVRAFVFSVKRFQNYDDAVSNVANWSGQFLRNGSSTQALDGTIASMYLPVNTDVITVHKEIKRYITCEGLATITFGTPANQIAMTNVNYQDTTKFFDVGVSCKKTLKYDSSNFSPQNFAPLFCLSYCHLDGSSPDVLTTVVSASFVSTFMYQDA